MLIVGITSFIVGFIMGFMFLLVCLIVAALNEGKKHIPPTKEEWKQT